MSKNMSKKREKNTYAVSISSIEHSAYLLHQFSSLVWSHMSKEKIKKQKHNAVRFDGLYN